MYIKKRNNLRILEQRKKELEQLAIKSAQRLREKKANNTVNIYKKKLVESIDKKRVNYGFLNLFSKEIEVKNTKVEYVSERFDVGGWILDCSMTEEYFEIQENRLTNNYKHHVHLEESKIYVILKNDGALKTLFVKNFLNGPVYSSSFPYRDDCVFRSSETRVDFYNFTFNDPNSQYLPSVIQLDLPRYSYCVNNRSESNKCIVRNFPIYLEKRQLVQNYSEDFIVNNYGKVLFQKLKSL
jgi:hypothetical protein